MGVILKNKRDKKICINFDDGKYAALLAKGTAKISDDSLKSPHLQAFVARGDVVVIREVKPEAEKKKSENTKEVKISSAYPKGEEKKKKEGKK